MKNIILIFSFFFFHTFIFSATVTGGGSLDPVYPTTNEELEKYLGDPYPRVIYINKEFNFLNSMGTKNEMGCRPASNTCPNIGQDAINPSFNWCGSHPPIPVTYDVSSTKFIYIRDNKTLKGIGNLGVIKSRGLRTAGSNIIIQNIHITELNRQYIWGGDGIWITDGDLILIDHCKVSHVGRQLLLISGVGKRMKEKSI